MATPSTPHKRLNLLQFYRGIAALLVVLFHIDDMTQQRLNQEYLFNVFASGWSGVDYFFTLSGFIMIYVHRSAIGKRGKLKEFLIKRAVRIYPIYWIITGVVLAFFLVMPGFANPNDLNLLRIIHSLLLIPYNDKPILDVGWTLVLEIFFYLLFCVAIWFKPKVSIPILATWLLVTLLYSFKIIQLSGPWVYWPQTIFGSMNLEFVWGAAAGYCVLNFSEQIKSKRWLLFYGSNFLYALLILLTAYDLLEVKREFTFGLVAALLIFASTSVDLTDSIKVPPLLSFLGDASYSIFLTHGPLVSIATKLIVKANLGRIYDNFLSQILLFLLTVIVGCLFYSVIEKPLTEYLRKNIVEKFTRKKSDFAPEKLSS